MEPAESSVDDEILSNDRLRESMVTLYKYWKMCVDCSEKQVRID